MSRNDAGSEMGVIAPVWVCMCAMGPSVVVLAIHGADQGRNQIVA